MTLGEKIKHYRNQEGLTQSVAAERLGVPFRTYQNWESDHRSPGFVIGVKLARLLNVTPDELLPDEEASSEEKET